VSFVTNSNSFCELAGGDLGDKQSKFLLEYYFKEKVPMPSTWLGTFFILFFSTSHIAVHQWAAA